VVPTGYSFNLDGSTLYQSIAAIFIAQLYGIDLSISQQLLLVLTLMVTSKGIAGVPGVSFVVLLATLGSVGIPLEGLAFIAGVDRIMDMARTALNVIGNALAVLVISRWEGMYDDAKGERYWNSLPHWRSKEAAKVNHLRWRFTPQTPDCPGLLRLHDFSSVAAAQERRLQWVAQRPKRRSCGPHRSLRSLQRLTFCEFCVERQCQPPDVCRF
jgi:hypothetical protein